jgi:hypothetical protein
MGIGLVLLTVNTNVLKMRCPAPFARRAPIEYMGL